MCLRISRLGAILALHCRVDGLRPTASALQFPQPALRGCSPVARCRALTAIEGDDGDEGSTDGELMSELRKALSALDEAELAASDERVLDGFVDDRKGQVSAFQDDFDRSLEAAQEAIESRLEGELRGVETDFMARVDAAVDSLRKGSVSGEDAAAAAAAAAASAAEGDDVPSATIPAGGLLVVAGASTALGSELLRVIGGDESGWRLRALVADGAKLDIGEVECESVPFAPFTPTALARSLTGAAAVVLISASAGGAGGIEADVVPKILKALDSSVRRLVIVSTHGVERTDKLPYNLRNVFGQLDKQRAAEQEVILQARRAFPAFTVVRLGALRDAPPSTSSSSRIVRAQIQPGDRLDGELPLSTASSILLQALIRDEAVNATLSVGPAAELDGTADAIGEEFYWDDEWLKLVGPELYRRTLTDVPVDEAILWLREWARRFTRPGQQLTTPVSVQDVDDGVLLRFLTRSGGGYADFDAEETADDKWAAAKPGASELASGEPDGALLLVAEGRPAPRVRVSRAEMVEGTVVKEMSEAAVLAKLDKALAELEKARRKG